MKGKITITITIGLICFILTAVMFIQFKTINQTDITSLENMREDELRAEIAKFKTKYEETIVKYEEIVEKQEEYQNTINTDTEASELLDQELKQVKDLLGYNEVKGSGIIITLTDTDKQKIVAEDVILLLNELKLAGAEAISINDQRIVYNSYAADIDNKYISVTGVRLVSPYIVKAIGNRNIFRKWSF